MNRRIASTILIVIAATAGLAAQDLVITNARILDGTGPSIDRGTIVIRGGRIVSVAAGGAGVPGVQTIDARGMTVLPGFIDGHRHIMGGN